MKDDGGQATRCSIEFGRLTAVTIIGLYTLPDGFINGTIYLASIPEFTWKGCSNSVAARTQHGNYEELCDRAEK